MQHKEPNIQAITSITTAITNPAAGDYLFLDIDGTLLITGKDKYTDAPMPTEAGLAAELKRLRERGIKVLGLTARKEKYRDATLQQLMKLGITLDDIIFAPAEQKTKGGTHFRKPPALQAYLSRCAQQPKRIFIFDNDIGQLQDIQQAFADTDILLHLKHYQPRHDQPIAIYQSHQHLFPAQLDGFHKGEALGGGTNSVFTIKHETSGQQFVLKFGAHEDAGKIEMLCNAVYRALGVRVPNCSVYHLLPRTLADELQLATPAGMFQVSEFIESQQECSEKICRDTARQDFVAHVLLGNIDVAKDDNFIINHDGKAVLIDAGANFLFRSKGKPRKQDAVLASEIDSLRNSEINQVAHEWFASLTEAEITAQVTAILSRHARIEQTVWDASNQLGIPEALRNRFLDYLSDRLDQLVTRFCLVNQPHAKTDKKAREDATAAGVLTYIMQDGEPYVLLSQRVRHKWWGNFGGKSERSDVYLADTARREVAEESSNILNYSSLELAQSPSHDLVTGSGNSQKIYRLYITPYQKIDNKQLVDNEHTEHQWVPVRTLLQAVKDNVRVLCEEQETVVIQSGELALPLYPPLLQMLQQPEVSANLQGLLQTGKLKPTCTLGFVDNTNQSQLDYLPLVTPVKKRGDIARALQHKSMTLREIKKTAVKPDEALEHTVVYPDSLSQSELHLKVVLGAEYCDGDLAANVRLFIKNHIAVYCQTLTGEQLNQLHQLCMSLILNERNGRSDKFYFYHGCNNEIAFAYDIYTAIYQALQADDRAQVFRLDSEHFRRFTNISEFIAYYSGNGRRNIDNYEDNFHDCALSTNVFLFGNHETATSNSVLYMLENLVSREIELKELLASVLRPFQITDEEITRITQLFDAGVSQQGGSLYQIAVSKADAQRMSYPAGNIGKLNVLDDVRDLPCIVQALQNRDLQDQATIKYITNLQARLLAPPHLPLEVHRINWQPLSAEQQQQYQHGLQQCVGFILDLIFRHHNILHNAHGGTAMLKVLPAILADNQLSLTAKVSGDVLARAIVANDATSVTSILQAYPEFLNEKISLPGQYIAGYDNNHRAEKFDPIHMIIAHSSLQLDVITASCGLPRLLDYVTAQANKQEVNLPLGELMARLPVTDRLNFALYAATNWLFSEDQLQEIVRQLQPSECLSFIEALAQQKTELAQLHYAHLAEDGCYVAATVRSLPEQVRTQFAFCHLAAVADLNSLVAILDLLPAADRLQYAEQYRGSFTSMNDVIRVLESFPDTERLGYLVMYQNMIITSGDLKAALLTLPAEEREHFARHHQACIKTGEDLYFVISALKEADRLDYVRRHQEKIKTTKELISIALRLPAAVRATVVADINIDVTDAVMVGAVLCFLDKEARQAYIKLHAIEMKDSEFLATVLSLFPIHQRLDFANDYASVVINGSSVATVTQHLPDHAREVFALAMQDKIRDVHDLAKILAVLPENNRYQYMMKNRHHILDAASLAEVLKNMPLKNQYDVAMYFDDLLKDADDLVTVMNTLHDISRVVFVSFNLALIQNAAQLKKIISCLPDQHKTYLVISCNSLIQDSNDLEEMLMVTPVERRADWANRCRHIPKNLQQILRVISYLYPHHAVTFAEPFLTQGKYPQLYALLASQLKGEAQFSFIIKYFREILACVSLEQVMGYINYDEDKLKLLEHFLKQITTFAELAAGLQQLPIARRYECVLSHLHLITDKKSLTVVLETLPCPVREECRGKWLLLQPIVKPVFFNRGPRPPQAIDAFLGNTTLPGKKI